MLYEFLEFRSCRILILKIRMLVVVLELKETRRRVISKDLVQGTTVTSALKEQRRSPVLSGKCLIQFGSSNGDPVEIVTGNDSSVLDLFAYDTVKKHLTPNPGEPSKIPIPPSLIAGACAGVSSTLCTYPLELVKTRLTVQRDVYNNLLHAFVKIVQEEGVGELYRGLTPSLIGVIPYAAANYCAYDMLRKGYRKVFKKEEISNIATLLIGSAAGAISSTATFPLEVARKQMQVGALSGRQVYKNMLHALTCILQQEGLPGLYRGLGPSCMKLVPAAGISFMCYEACKKILVEKEGEA
ncbi:hypothetical protein MKX01_005312 [Papaver californicum]|nr:hypothetical protein MKX01_005312 [Papaver californicum]